MLGCAKGKIQREVEEGLVCVIRPSVFVNWCLFRGETHLSYLYNMQIGERRPPNLASYPPTGTGGRGAIFPDACISQRWLPRPWGNVLRCRRFISQACRGFTISSFLKSLPRKSEVRGLLSGLTWKESKSFGSIELSEADSLRGLGSS